jgi:hypothetical protein
MTRVIAKIYRILQNSAEFYENSAELCKIFEKQPPFARDNSELFKEYFLKYFIKYTSNDYMY